MSWSYSSLATGVTGDFSYTIDTTAIRIEITTVPDYYGHTTGVPIIRYGLGWFAWSRNGLYFDLKQIWNANLLDVRAHVGYQRVDGHLNTGVVATIYSATWT